MSLAVDFARASDGASRSEWLAWRRGGIGASDIAAILGLSPWASPWSVWAEKVGLIGEQPDNEAMEAGRWLERAIAPWFSDRTGLFVVSEQMWCEHPRYRWMRCTPDGFVAESSSSAIGDALGAFEIKAPWSHREWPPGDPVPAQYKAQGQWQMAVTGLDRVWFAVLHGRKLRVYDLARDQGDIDFMTERAAEWWERYVLRGVAPETDGSDATASAIARAWPEHIDDAMVELDADAHREWTEAKAALAIAAKRAKTASNALRAALGEAEVGTVDGQQVVTYRAQTRAPYSVAESTFRVLRPVGAKEAGK